MILLIPATAHNPHGTAFYNDATHGSTVDTDGKNREAACGKLLPD